MSFIIYVISIVWDFRAKIPSEIFRMSWSGSCFFYCRKSLDLKCHLARQKKAIISVVIWEKKKNMMEREEKFWSFLCAPLCLKLMFHCDCTEDEWMTCSGWWTFPVCITWKCVDNMKMCGYDCLIIRLFFFLLKEWIEMQLMLFWIYFHWLNSQTGNMYTCTVE